MRNFAVAAGIVLVAFGTTYTVPRTHAGEVNLRETHRGVSLIGVPPDPAADYDVRVIGAREALDKVRAALDLLLEKSPYTAAAIETLKSSGPVGIAYDPAFPYQVTGNLGVVLAEFMPYFPGETPNPGEQKKFRVVVSRYIVKWKTDELAAVLAHELLGHGMQHLRGRSEAMSERDMECEASLYEEIANQDVGLDKYSLNMRGFRQNLEWFLCTPFKQYMTMHSPAQMALWKKLNPDVPQLLAVFEEYVATKENMD